MKKKTYKDVTSFVVDRKNWYRGQSAVNSKLLNDEGKMCCLGFYAMACGLRKQDIKNKRTLPEVINLGKNWQTKLVDPADTVNNVVMQQSSFLCRELMSVNDFSFLPEEEREKRLMKKFQSIGIEITFVG